VAACVFIFGNSVFAQPIKINDLIEEARAYDGKRVVVEGEVIGHLMRRGNFAWLNINDTTNAVGIWATFDSAKDIKYLGKHAVIGDKVKVEGVFHLKCPGHGGDTDIHAESITIIDRGSPRHLAYEPKKVNIIIFLIAILACLYIIKILKRMR
jgi:hypothetical protein